MNENDIERQLQQQPLTGPSADLDRRMKVLFHNANPKQMHPPARTVPIWLMAAACLVCAIAGFGVRSLSIFRQSPPTVVYVFPPSEAMSRLLNGSTASRNSDFDFSHAHAQVLQPPAAQGNQL